MNATAKPHANAALSDSQCFIPYPRPAHLIQGSCEPLFAIVGRDIAEVQLRQAIRNSRHLCKNIKLFQRFPRLLH